MNEVFIVAMPRSGSTMLQTALNQSSSDILIYGEHMAILTGLADHHRALCSMHHMFHDPVDTLDAIKHPPQFWPYVHANGIDRNKLVTRLRDYVEATLNPLGAWRWGFKQVDYTSVEINLLAELFPTAKFILLVRRPQDQISSSIGTGGWGDRSPEDWFQRWKAQYESFVDVALARPDNARLIPYESLVAQSAYVERLCAWLELDAAGVLDTIFKKPKIGPTANKAILPDVFVEKLNRMVNYECLGDLWT